MSLFKVFIAAILIIGLSACGFKPMYNAENTAGVSSLQGRADIEIGNIPNQDGQYLRNALVDRIYIQGRPADAPYRLNFSPLKETKVNIGIRKDASATRAQIQISTKMELIEKSSGKVILKRKFKVVGAYDLLDNHFATMISKRDITENILQELANDTLTELNLYFYKYDELTKGMDK